MKFEIKKVKIVVMVPRDNTDEVRDALCKNGAGIIGNYSYCTTSVKSIGTFIPNKEANPYIGKNNKLEQVEEDKLEVICDVEHVKKVINKLRKAHPYEEPEIDIVPLLDEDDFN